MSDNVESFDSFESEQQIAAHQAGLVKIVLEGKSDVELFKRFWFSNMLDVFEFVDASSFVVGTGCRAVRQAVTECLTNLQIPAAGIVDRDSLFADSNWALLYTTDDARFDSEARTADVFVTSFWEIEAYVLEPDLLKPWVVSSHRPPPGPAGKADRALADALLECEVLLNSASCFAAMHAGGQAVNAGMYVGHDAATVQAMCAAKIASLPANLQSVASATAALIASILSTRPAEDRARLIYSLRYVDTKRLLMRLFRRLNVPDNSHWVLPLLQLERGRRPDELEQFLLRVKSRYHA